MTRRTRLNIFLEAHHARQLRVLAATKGVSQSGIIATALASFLSPDGLDRREAALAKRLDRLSHLFERIERDQTILIETLALFIRLYLSTTTPLGAGQQDAARAQGKARFEAFIDQLGRHLQRGGSLVKQVAAERVGCTSRFLRVISVPICPTTPCALSPVAIRSPAAASSASSALASVVLPVEVPPAMTMLRRSASLDVRTVLIERHMTDLVVMLGTGAIDAIFAPRKPSSADTLSLPAWSEPLVLLTPAHLKGGAVLPLGELALPLFVPDRFFLPGFAAQLDAFLPKALPRAQSRYSSMGALYALVGAGHGVGLLPMSMAISTDLVRVRGVRTKKARVTFWMTVRRDDDTPAVVILRDAVAAGVIRASPPRAA